MDPCVPGGVCHSNRCQPRVRYPPSTRPLGDADLCAAHWTSPPQGASLTVGLLSARAAWGREDGVILQGASGFPTFPSFCNHSLAWSPSEQDPQGVCRAQAKLQASSWFEFSGACCIPADKQASLHGPQNCAVCVDEFLFACLACLFVAFSVISHM